MRTATAPNIDCTGTLTGYVITVDFLQIGTVLEHRLKRNVSVVQAVVLILYSVQPVHIPNGAQTGTLPEHTVHIRAAVVCVPAPYVQDIDRVVYDIGKCTTEDTAHILSVGTEHKVIHAIRNTRDAVKRRCIRLTQRVIGLADRKSVV